MEPLLSTSYTCTAFRLAKFDTAFGRLQTKFVARSGVFAKSLDRNNSNGFNVNWTDGVHATYHFSEQSIVHFIAEYNSPDGPSSIRRGPLDLTPSSARTSYFVAWESQERLGPFTQRGFDISYLPSALVKDGPTNDVREDYVGLVARYAMAKSFGTRGRRWNVAGEFGYAPETPTERSVGLAGDGDADGFAWNVMASLMDLWPDHSIGINYGRAGAGWLLSPQYRDNEELVEIRYLWRRRQNLAIDVRLRWRQHLEAPVLETERVNEGGLLRPLYRGLYAITARLFVRRIPDHGGDLHAEIPLDTSAVRPRGPSRAACDAIRPRTTATDFLPRPTAECRADLEVDRIALRVTAADLAQHRQLGRSHGRITEIEIAQVRRNHGAIPCRVLGADAVRGRAIEAQHHRSVVIRDHFVGNKSTQAQPPALADREVITEKRPP